MRKSDTASGSYTQLVESVGKLGGSVSYGNSLVVAIVADRNAHPLA
jgi:hypothetical protein